MKILLSPAKKLDFSEEIYLTNTTNCKFLDYSEILINELKKKSALELSKLMNISHNLSILNFKRNQEWQRSKILKEGKAALLAFKGEVYTNMKTENFNKDDFSFLDSRLRILSGLYGILSPSDMILPYRLEMGTKLNVGINKNLYEFWRDILTKYINNESSDNDIILNLASDEYSKVLDFKKIKSSVITPIFKDIKNGKAKVVSFFAKRSRGEMCNFIVKNRINDINQIKKFNRNNYVFSQEESDENNYIFIR
tara:strand:- start:20004 stop:20762 length:759 start_codon:yes stop_codon:yes gene_type:complete